MSTYTLIWSARNRTPEFNNSLFTADSTFPSEVKFLVVDAASSQEHIESVRCKIDRLNDISCTKRNIRLIESPKRITVSQAWNLGMMLADTDFFIFASSDVEFLSDKLFRRFQLEYQRTNSPYILSGNHAVFMLHKSILQKVGWFDESFTLGPHFDTDFMLRAQEAGINVTSIPNEGMYIHGDTPEETILRSTTGLEDRLPMNDFTNDRVFKEKWQTDWPGWEPYINDVHKPHPPNHISQVKRLVQEINWHPSFS